MQNPAESSSADTAERADEASPKDDRPARLPATFVSHGAPLWALDPQMGARWREVAAALPAKPRAVLVVSAHWERAPITLGTTTRRELYHDYSGFPDELRRLRYDAPGAPELAARVRELVPESADSPERPWDHGVWVPLLHLLPQADVPVLQLSLPTRLPADELTELGAALAPLRDEGVWILASGSATHNLGELEWRGAGATPDWAREFEGWTREALTGGDRDALVHWQQAAPHARRAHPSIEHFVPLLVAQGASSKGGDVRFPVDGFEYGSLSRLVALLD